MKNKNLKEIKGKENSAAKKEGKTTVENGNMYA